MVSLGAIETSLSFNLDFVWEWHACASLRWVQMGPLEMPFILSSMNLISLEIVHMIRGYFHLASTWELGATGICQLIVFQGAVT